MLWYNTLNGKTETPAYQTITQKVSKLWKDQSGLALYPRQSHVRYSQSKLPRMRDEIAACVAHEDESIRALERLCQKTKPLAELWIDTVGLQTLNSQAARLLCYLWQTTNVSSQGGSLSFKASYSRITLRTMQYGDCTSWRQCEASFKGYSLFN